MNIQERVCRQINDQETHSKVKHGSQGGSEERTRRRKRSLTGEWIVEDENRKNFSTKGNESQVVIV